MCASLTFLIHCTRVIIFFSQPTTCADDLRRGWSGNACAGATDRIIPLPYIQLLPAGILWGAGTAAGEIPPYFVSYSAAKLGSKVRQTQLSLTKSTHVFVWFQV